MCLWFALKSANLSEEELPQDCKQVLSLVYLVPSSRLGLNASSPAPLQIDNARNQREAVIMQLAAAHLRLKDGPKSTTEVSHVFETWPLS